MSNGGMDGYDWLESFLPADSQPDHDLNFNNEAYQTHPAFHDAEQVARAAVMHQKAPKSYSFMRSTNTGTNHALNPSQAYSQASGGQYGGNKHQQNSNIPFNNPPSSHPAYPTDSSHHITQRPNPPVPSQQHFTAQGHQYAYRRGDQSRMDPAGPPQRPSNSIPHSSEAYQSTYRSYETTRPTVPAQRTNQPMARAVPTSQSPYQGYSATPNQNSQMLTQPHMAQGMMTQVQRTYTPVASQSHSYSHSTIPSHNAQRPPHSTAAQGARPTPPVQRTHTPVARPQEPQSPYQRHSTIPTQNVQRSSHPNAPPSSHSSVDTELYTPLVSPKGFKTSATCSTLEPRQSMTPATSTEEASNPSRQNPATNPARSNPTPPGPSFHKDHVQPAVPTVPDRVHSPATSQPVLTRSPSVSLVSSAPVSAPISASTPPPSPAQTTIVQRKGRVPAEEHPSGSMPPAKMRRLDNCKSQTMTPQNDPSAGSSVPGAQVSMGYARPRGPSKILKNRDDLVQPIIQSYALLKVSYDPTTIARDVLIAAGRHPTEKHLNHHLEALRRNFTKLDYVADLATFRWDLVDVKQPEPQVDRMPRVPVPQMPPSRPPQPAWQLLPRDPGITPNHVIPRDYAHMPSRDTPPNRQAAMTERIDARAPPGGLSPWGTLPFKPPTYHSPQHIFPSNLPSGLPRVDPAPALPKFSSHQSVPLPTPPPPPQPQPQQRRPSTTNSAAPPKPPPTTKQQANPEFITKPKPQGKTVKSQSDSGRSVKSPEARRLPQPQVVIPLSPAKMPVKKRPGRPPKSAAKNIEVAIHREQPVNYQIFPCKWEGCTAELHNIDSVRAHLIKVHIPHSLVCKWKDCGNKTPMAAADMFTHLSTEHIAKMAWALGDGPTVPVTGENHN